MGVVVLHVDAVESVRTPMAKSSAKESVTGDETRSPAGSFRSVSNSRISAELSLHVVTAFLRCFPAGPCLDGFVKPAPHPPGRVEPGQVVGSLCRACDRLAILVARGQAALGLLGAGPVKGKLLRVGLEVREGVEAPQVMQRRNPFIEAVDNVGRQPGQLVKHR